MVFRPRRPVTSSQLCGASLVQTRLSTTESKPRRAPSDVRVSLLGYLYAARLIKTTDPGFDTSTTSSVTLPRRVGTKSVRSLELLDPALHKSHPLGTFFATRPRLEFAFKKSSAAIRRASHGMVRACRLPVVHAKSHSKLTTYLEAELLTASSV